MVMMTSFNMILSISLLVSSLVTVALCASGNTMVVLNKPASVNLIDCTPDNCQVTHDDLVEVAAAASLKSSSVNSEVPWIEAFGLTPNSRPSRVVVVVCESTDASFKSSSNSPQFDFRLTDSCHHVFGEGSDESINYVEMGCEQGRGVGKWGENELVVGVQISSEEAQSMRVRRQAEESSDKQQATASGPPRNIYYFRKEGSAASFEFAVWFAIVFAIAVFLICVVLMQIDQGDDSIIYKTTSAKMGKRD